jgi:hypothetical protein
MTITELEKMARTLRLDIVKMLGVGQKGHLGGSCSLAEIVTVLCFNRMKHDPRDAKWLTEPEKQDLVETLHEEQQFIKPVKNYAEAFKSWAVILLCLQYAFWSIGVYGFVMWLPSIIKAAPDMSIVRTG